MGSAQSASGRQHVARMTDALFGEPASPVASCSGTLRPLGPLGLRSAPWVCPAAAVTSAACDSRRRQRSSPPAACPLGRPPSADTADKAAMSFFDVKAASGRFEGVTRPYTEQDVQRLRGSVHVQNTLAQMGADKLWELLQAEPYVHALGALSGNQASRARAPRVRAGGSRQGSQVGVTAESGHLNAAAPLPLLPPPAPPNACTPPPPAAPPCVPPAPPCCLRRLYRWPRLA